MVRYQVEKIYYPISLMTGERDALMHKRETYSIKVVVGTLQPYKHLLQARFLYSCRINIKKKLSIPK